MAHWRFARLVRHPVIATVIAVSLFLIVVKVAPNSVYGAELFAAADNPAKIADLRLKRSFDQETAERRISLALAQGNVDLAQSFVDLSRDCHVPINPALLDKVKAAKEYQDSVGHKVSGFIHGFWTGEANDTAALAGDALSDGLFFGDIRDMAKETVHYVTGQHYDGWILAMSAAGVAATTATYFAGAGLPERVGLSIAKVVRRSDRLNPALAARITEAAESGTLTEIAGNAARIEERAGVQTALDSLALTKDPDDVARVEQLAASKGSKTGAILKMFGRGAFTVSVTAWVVAKWVAFIAFVAASFVFWAVTALVGFFAWGKSVVGRVVRFFTLSRQRATIA